MAQENERLMILDLLEKGKVTSEEADKLLVALKPSEPVAVPGAAATGSSEELQRAHWIRIRVTENSSGKKKFSMTLPIFLMRLGIRFGKRYTDSSLDSSSFEAGKEFFRRPVKGKVVDVADPDDDEHVEISFL
jgi:hypothetical protein